MDIAEFIKKVKTSPETLEFNELMELIDTNYTFTPTAFGNGELRNEVGENSGSCKLFSFAKSHALSVNETLACFGEYYREDVLENPTADNHQNIRNFMKTGWDGISFTGEALSLK